MHYTQAYDITDESTADVINAITEACAIAPYLSFSIADDCELRLHVGDDVLLSPKIDEAIRIVGAYFTPISGD